jgi:hypothetical protein
MENYKFLVPMAELINIPSQKENFLRALEDPKEKSVEKHKEVNEDALAILQGTNQSKGNGSHQPFFISLLANDLLLHNCMLDSWASSNVMTRKFMKQLNFRISRP